MSNNADAPYKDCSIIRYFDKKFAMALAPACQLHDEDYRYRRGLFASEVRFIRAMWSISKLRAIVYGSFLFLGGWFLYYDLDKKLGL